MELFAMILVVAATGALILWPLLRRAERNAEIPDPPPDRGREKEMALAALRELEFDFATGKVSPEDHAVLRARYEARAVEAIAQAQRRISPAATSADAASDGGEIDLDAHLEAEIAAARGRAHCPACGEPLPGGARFCYACGAAVGVEVTR